MHAPLPVAVACVFAAACAAPPDGASLRNTPEDRWRAAAERFERDLEARGVASRAAGADASDRAVRVAATQAPSQVIVVPAAPTGYPTVTTYDVNDLVQGRPSFAAPRLGLGLGPMDEEPAGVTYHAPLDGETLAEAIRRSVDPGSWDEEGNSVEVVNGRLIVRRKNGD